ncbi:DUF4397 domain-containing protein [Natrinema salsiterrestre]|uniref:DUF4397 domain-containing protein n=1 Tax=Natrinema salsiterrestre TaxID=2950540 RepID=A0A9Q4KZH7_9EURY|nr:DUF4397 domain-containing protein [Natrinema salsiterrestre]MDF9746918.1 DUF4397 domain-containing protein [Natrinema salsiterrestre]
MAHRTAHAIGLVTLLLIATVAWGIAAPVGATTDADESAADEQLEERKQTIDPTATERAIVQGDNESADDESEEANTSRIRIVHLSPLIPEITADVGFETVAENLSFGTVSDYEVVEAGETDLEVETTENGDEILETEQTLEPAGSYSFVVIGDVTANETVQFQPALLRDEFEAPNESEASIRFIHGSPDVSAVDVTVAETNTTIAENVSYREDSDYVTVPAGNVTLEVREAADDNSGEIIRHVNLSLESGTIYSAAVTGYRNPDETPVDVPLNVGVFEDARLENESNESE